MWHGFFTVQVCVHFVQAAWGRPVLDRVGLIIEIFGAHAQTREAKLQV
jgi:50S ribosomal subunit-associated GTPase HflX